MWCIFYKNSNFVYATVATFFSHLTYPKKSIDWNHPLFLSGGGIAKPNFPCRRLTNGL